MTTNNQSNPEKVYSRNEEVFHDDYHELLVDMDSDGNLVAGNVIWEGEKVQREASFYFRGGVDTIIEGLRDQAWEEAGEFAETWLENVPKEKLAELGDVISKWLDANLPVNFWTVDKVKKIELTEEMIAEHKA
jgi:hypothetical protein